MRGILIAVLVGVVLLGVTRLLFAPLNRVTHHHANWTIMVDGTEIDLSADRFMEEIAACTGSDTGIAPTQRIHMHENDAEVVHVHHAGATWGHLMANLGLGLGPDYLFLDAQLVEGIEGAGDGRFVDVPGDDRRLVFVLNGFVVPSVFNRVVESEDRLLITWTDQPVDRLVESEFPAVASNAAEFNQRMDPASCSGGHGELPLLTRLRLAFWG